MATAFDVIIIGGSYAGLSAAMALGRALRSVLIIDSGKPCNLQTPHSHNLITHDGEIPSNIAELALEQVLAYPTVVLKDGIAIDAAKLKDGFTILTADGETYTAKKLLFATGLKDIMPDIPGFAECWGISVIHCPYCHGYEVRHQPTALLANGEMAYEFGSLLTNWTSNLTIFTNGPSTLTTQQTEKLAQHKVSINQQFVSEIIHNKGYIDSVVFANGDKLELNAMYAKIGFEQHSTLPEQLGCKLTEHGLIYVNEMQETSVEGIYAAGDNTTLMRSLSNAIAAGGKAGAMINHKLVKESF
ncbi:NAD(P)/FAD-dependent oxidoreductase [Mucilaginibacter pallidiroseus]|uniref:NAD(P)/FAD-dependent oxidoreductase n=1 Tax=Mucilaginibacter pallidiroseus TaxID=2599295 RepID=A0A563UBS8_9SPHI|nr:NAD(P)/FAD-dependent oxidoreductase [Mucilaginibacter pallidiroseus]TWR28805.1 NAD(P)/FAD-dependent oxidoreductase [Mucilaginibacter pallidiroseus]